MGCIICGLLLRIRHRHAHGSGFAVTGIHRHRGCKCGAAKPDHNDQNRGDDAQKSVFRICHIELVFELFQGCKRGRGQTHVCEQKKARQIDGLFRLVFGSGLSVCRNTIRQHVRLRQRTTSVVSERPRCAKQAPGWLKNRLAEVRARSKPE